MRWVVATIVAGCGFAPVAGTSQDGTDAAGDGVVHDGATDAMHDARVVLDAPASALTDDYADVADTFLASDLPTTVFTTQTSALADGDVLRVALFRFDLSAIAPTATVSAAELHIWTDFDPGGTCTFHQVLESWDDATATWNQRAAGTGWTNAGAEPPGSSAAVAIGTVDPAVAGTEYIVAITPAVVAGWVATPATNFGLAITTTQSDGTRFTTRESATTTAHAFLRVTHIP
jgi:hypothetical protein